MELLKRLFKQIMTNKVNEFEPIRVIGLTSFVAAFIVYLIATMVTVLRSGTLPWIEWSTGVTALFTTLIALAGAMRIKETTERQPGDPLHDTPPPT